MAERRLKRDQRRRPDIGAYIDAGATGRAKRRLGSGRALRFGKGLRLMPGDDRAYVIDHQMQGDVSVLKLLSKQYFSDSQSIFAAYLAEAEAASPTKCVILDLGEAQQLTSGPLGALRAAYARLDQQGGRIVAAGGGEFAVKVLSFAANFIDHFPTLDAAMRNIATDA